VLSGRGLCDELITRPEECYRLWCVVVCDLENLVNEEVMTRVGSQRHTKKKKKKKKKRMKERKKTVVLPKLILLISRDVKTIEQLTEPKFLDFVKPYI